MRSIRSLLRNGRIPGAPSSGDAGVRSSATFQDPAIERAFSEEGYVVVDLLDPVAVGQLADRCRVLHPVRTATWESDFYSPSEEVKRTVHDDISSALRAPLRDLLVAHRSILHNFVINWPGDDGGLVLHQHSSIVDETVHRSLVLWCALTDATEENGALHVVPRSHHLQRGPRPERSTSWCVPHEQQILREHLRSVPIGMGQAILFDNQLLHCSFPNRTDEARIAAVAIVAPTAAQLRFYEAIDSDRVRVHELDPDFFLQHDAGVMEWASPDALPVIGEEPWEPTTVDAAQLSSVLGAGSCRHGGR